MKWTRAQETRKQKPFIVSKSALIYKHGEALCKALSIHNTGQELLRDT